MWSDGHGAVHYTDNQYRNFGHQPPNKLAGIWDDYTALLESFLKNAAPEFMQVITAGLSGRGKISDSRSVNFQYDVPKMRWKGFEFIRFRT